MTVAPRDSQDGLEWDIGLFCPEPHWTREPSISAIESVSRQHLNIPSEHLCSVAFFAAGVFNKLYRVDYAGQSLIMRLSLPVYPHHKTRGEVATLRWLRLNSTAPVPKVVAFDDCNDNEIGFEWILMELMPGFPAQQRWRTMSMEKKVALTGRIAEIQAELFYHEKLDSSSFSGIGTLHASTKGKKAEVPTPVAPGRLVAHEFFLAGRVNYDVPRGPFHSSSAWLESMIKILILEQTAVVEKAQDDDDKEDAEAILLSARRLLSILPKVFPDTEENCVEPTVLWHDDLNLNNMLVDEEGDLTAIVDWECVSLLPIWMTTNMPRFLQGENRSEEPTPDEYSDETPEGSTDSGHGSDLDKLDNEGKNSLYWMDMMEYDATKLREVYKARLRELWPGWPLQDRAGGIATGTLRRRSKWREYQHPASCGRNRQLCSLESGRAKAQLAGIPRDGLTARPGSAPCI
ncbi:kinase-like protein [Xylaria palmicola]|nr:kinase-like protein [Xylaria palmicola]